jgi:4-hydroxymandelate oxidase
MADAPTLLHRRKFLQFAAASPAAGLLGGTAAVLLRAASAQEPEPTALLTAPADALSVFDLEAAARRRVHSGHWANMISGVDDDGTLRANREIFSQVQLRPRRFRDTTQTDTRVELFGNSYASPVFLCPVGGLRSFHADGEVAAAKAATRRSSVMMLSTMSSIGIEDVNRVSGRPVWYQLYAPSPWPACEQMLRRVEAAGTTIVVLTCDLTGGRNLETYRRARPQSLAECAACHGLGEPPGDLTRRPMFRGLEVASGRGLSALDWTYFDRLRAFWRGKLIIKGIDTREDARLAMKHGADGIVVSNHGGRATETLRSTLESLPEVVAAVAGRIPVLIDGGFRRGTDVFKALALGATAVGIGRPMMWGLGAFGEEGVDRVLDILQRELRLAMSGCGTRTVAEITREYVATRGRQL